MTCADCTGETDTARREPLGRDGANVVVCDACADEHPRSGRYAFEGSASAAVHRHGGCCLRSNTSCCRGGAR